jgi:hypothetical protein
MIIDGLSIVVNNVYNFFYDISFYRMCELSGKYLILNIYGFFINYLFSLYEFNKI